MQAQPKIRHELAMPPGLKMAYDVISADEEMALIAEIEAMGLPPFIHDPENPRCTKTFGWDYGWPDEAISVCEPIPPSLHAVRDLAADLAGIRPDQLIQGQVIRYEPGAIIQHHCDKRVWVSLAPSLVRPLRERPALFASGQTSLP